MDQERESKNFDIVIVGGGVLGISLYYWLTGFPNLSVALVEKEGSVAFHTSSRNTGVIHRPFYLDPERKKVQAMSAGISYFLWKDLARESKAPWLECGTIEVARNENEVKTLEKYSRWSVRNGLSGSDVSLLSGREVSDLEHEVVCEGAIFSRTDVSTDFGFLTSELSSRSGNEHSRLYLGSEVVSVVEDDSSCTLLINSDGQNRAITAGFLINAAGGSSLRIAQSMGYARNYSVLFFRGEYWRVGADFESRIGHNIYSVPRHTKYPFLDPHFINRADGRKEIGPNAVMVGGPEVYSGMSSGGSSMAHALLGRPWGPKIRLLRNREFLSLVSSEWKSSIYKSEMASRVRAFIPSLEDRFLTGRGIAGVRASIIDKDGFVPEALTIFGKRSIHILNYNSPGATGAPAFSAHVIKMIESRGFLHGSFSRTQLTGLWDYNSITDAMGPVT